MLVIYGPTATGKTNLAIQLAKKFNGEIISADSRQVYKRLDIGTGKVSIDSKTQKYTDYWEVSGVRINGFDLIYPGEQFTAADFLKFASTTMIRIIEEDKLPIITGGAGFYIKALIDGIDSIGVPADQKLRQKLGKLSVIELYQKLTKIDQERAKSMNNSDRQNPRRLFRAIEIASSATKSATNYKRPTTNYLIIGLTAPNEFLYRRADYWLETRLESGMADEVKNIIKQGVDPKWLDNLGLEYRWLSRYLTGKISKEEAFERLKGDIHDFIRRQKTWFSKFKGIKLFDIAQNGWRARLEKNIEDWYTHV